MILNCMLGYRLCVSRVVLDEIEMLPLAGLAAEGWSAAKVRSRVTAARPWPGIRPR